MQVSKAFFKNKRTEIVKNPKVYFIDTGIRNTVINDFRSLADRTDKGSILENGLAMQFIKQETTFNFWRDKKKNEVDFVLSLGNGKISAVESKTSLKKAIANLPKYSRKIIPKLKFYSVIGIKTKKKWRKLANIRFICFNSTLSVFDRF